MPQWPSAAPGGAKNAFVVDDNTTYGMGLANFFTRRSPQGRHDRRHRTSITADQISNLPQLASTIAALNPMSSSTAA